MGPAFHLIAKSQATLKMEWWTRSLPISNSKDEFRARKADGWALDPPLQGTIMYTSLFSHRTVQIVQDTHMLGPSILPACQPAKVLGRPLLVNSPIPGSVVRFGKNRSRESQSARCRAMPGVLGFVRPSSRYKDPLIAILQSRIVFSTRPDVVSPSSDRLTPEATRILG